MIISNLPHSSTDSILCRITSFQPRHPYPALCLPTVLTRLTSLNFRYLIFLLAGFNFSCLFMLDIVESLYLILRVARFDCPYLTPLYKFFVKLYPFRLSVRASAQRSFPRLTESITRISWPSRPVIRETLLETLQDFGPSRLFWR